MFSMSPGIHGSQSFFVEPMSEIRITDFSNETFTSVGLHCGLKSPVFQNKLYYILVDLVEGRNFLTLRSP